MNRSYLWTFIAVAPLLFACPKKEEANKPPPEASGEHKGVEEEHEEGEHKEGEEEQKEGGGEHGEEGEITLTPEALQAANLKTAKVERRAVRRGLMVPARITFSPKDVAKVAARVPGRLASIEVVPGQKVKKGETLGFLESAELGQARAEYLSAATRARVAENNYQREKELLAKGITSEREMRQAESEAAAARAQTNAADGKLHSLGLNDSEIKALKADEHYSSRFAARSPLDGTVIEVGGTVGQAVEPTSTLFTVADLRELWILLDVYEAQLPLIAVGQGVNFTTSAQPGRNFRGLVQHIGEFVDEKTRTVTVRLAVPNPDGALKPGMFAQAEITTLHGDSADGGPTAQANLPLVVPSAAVHKVGEDNVVFIVEETNRFRAVKVKVGERSAEEVEILSGADEGQTVVTQGAFILKSELSKESMGEGHSH